MAIFGRGYPIHPWIGQLSFVIKNSAVTLTAGLVVDTESFYQPTVTTSYTLEPGLFADTDTFYAPAVTAGSVSLLPDLFADTEIFYAPAVTSSASLLPGLVTDVEVFYAPTITTGAVSLLPDLFTDEETFYQPTVTPGAVTLLPSLVLDTESFYAPTVESETELLPDLVADTDTIYSATITTGAVTLLPSLVDDTDVFPAPDVNAGGAHLFPDRVPDFDTIYAPSLSTSAQILPDFYQDPFEQIIVPLNVSSQLQPPLVTEADAFFAPSISTGPRTLLPARVIDLDIFRVPVVQLQGQQGGGGGGGNGGSAGDVKYASSMVMTQSGLITAVGVVSNGARTLNSRMMIYDNAAGQPGALLAQSATKTNVVNGSNTYSLLVPLSRVAGQTIWIAFHTDGNIQWFISNSPQGSRFNNDVFSDGPSDPFGVASNDNKKAPFFAIFLAAVNATIAPDGRVLDAETFYAPAVTTSKTLIPSLMISDDAIYPLDTLSQNLFTPPFLDDAEAIHAPIVTTLATIAPPLLSDPDALLQPAVGQSSAPDRDVFSAAFEDQDQIYPPEVTPVGGDTLPGLVVDQDQIDPPTVDYYNDVVPEFIADNEVIYDLEAISTIEDEHDHYADQDSIEPPMVTITEADQTLVPEMYADDDLFGTAQIGRPHRIRAIILGSRGTADILGRSDKTVDLEGTAVRTIEIEGEG